MEISACADGFGEHNTGCIEGLPCSEEIASSSDFLDENWCETFRP